MGLQRYIYAGFVYKEQHSIGRKSREKHIEKTEEQNVANRMNGWLKPCSLDHKLEREALNP